MEINNKEKKAATATVHCTHQLAVDEQETTKKQQDLKLNTKCIPIPVR